MLLFLLTVDASEELFMDLISSVRAIFFISIIPTNKNANPKNELRRSTTNKAKSRLNSVKH